MYNHNKEFTRQDRIKIFSHIPIRTQRSWIDSGLVESSGENYDGRGLKRKFRFENLLQMALVEQLNRLNVPHNVIRNIMATDFFGLKDEEPKILKHAGDILIVFKGEGFTKTFHKDDGTKVEGGWVPELWKATTVSSDKLSEFFNRFFSPAGDDAIMHAIKFGFEIDPVATILVSLRGVRERLLAYMSMAHISPFKPIPL